MPNYLFTADDGSEIEEYFSMAKCPTWGSTIERGGKVYTRLVSAPQVKPVKDYRFKGWSLEPWTKGADAYMKDGTPCFTSKKSAEECAAMNGGTYGKSW